MLVIPIMDSKILNTKIKDLYIPNTAEKVYCGSSPKSKIKLNKIIFYSKRELLCNK